MHQQTVIRKIEDCDQVVKEEIGKKKSYFNAFVKRLELM